MLLTPKTVEAFCFAKWVAFQLPKFCSYHLSCSYCHSGFMAFTVILLAFSCSFKREWNVFNLCVPSAILHWNSHWLYSYFKASSRKSSPPFLKVELIHSVMKQYSLSVSYRHDIVLDKWKKDTISCPQRVHSLMAKIMTQALANTRGNNYCTEGCGYLQGHNPTWE